MELNNYFSALTKPEKEAYAKRVGYSFDYIRVHLLPANNKPDRTPPLNKLEAMAKESMKKVSFSEVINHFKKAA